MVEEEYIAGISLQEMIDGGERMEEARAAALIASLCRTLSELHAMGIIHRDVKPEHILLTPEGNVYLIDFDAAMQLAPEKQSDTRLLGTAIYAAPEQFGLTRSDVRTDIFAVGISLNILLTGVHPAVGISLRDFFGAKTKTAIRGTCASVWNTQAIRSTSTRPMTPRRMRSYFT